MESKREDPEQKSQREKICGACTTKIACRQFLMENRDKIVGGSWGTVTVVPFGRKRQRKTA
jgi:hypothetical protein